MDMIKIHGSRNVNGNAHVLIEHYPSATWLVVSASAVIKETALFPAVVYTRVFTGAIAEWAADYSRDLYKTDDDMQTVLNKLNDGTLHFEVTCTSA